MTQETSAPRLSVPRGVTTNAEDESPPRGYHERKIGGWCVYGACPRRAEGWPEPIHDHCARHRKKVQARMRTQRAASRATLAEAGKCVRCRKPSKTYRCPGCRLLDGCDLPPVSVTTGVTAEKILAATSKDPDGRTRYRGQQKRGQQPKHQLNEQDLRHIKQDFDAFVTGIQMLGLPDKLAMHKSDYARAELAVAAVGDRMSRRVDDVLERLGHFKQRHGPRVGK